MNRYDVEIRSAGYADYRPAGDRAWVDMNVIVNGGGPDSDVKYGIIGHAEMCRIIKEWEARPGIRFNADWPRIIARIGYDPR